MHKGDDLGSIEIYETAHLTGIPVETEYNPAMTVNSTYNLDITEEERETRWKDQLCSILKVDQWQLSEQEKQIALTGLKKYEFCFALSDEESLIQVRK